MGALGQGDQRVNDLLQRLHMARHFEVVLGEGVDGQTENLMQRVGEVGDLRLCLVGEGNLLRVDLLRRADEVDRVVAQAFKIADGVQQS